jgi:hypothetical protein
MLRRSTYRFNYAAEPEHVVFGGESLAEHA